MTTLSYILPDRAILRLSGPDTFEFLRGIVTQSLTKLTPEQAVYSLLLTPQGKIIADFFLTTSGEDILLETSTSIVETLKQKLTLYKLRAKVEITDESEQWQVASVWDEEDKQRGETPGTMLDYGPEGLMVYIDPRLSSLGMRVKAPAGKLAGLLDKMNAKTTSAEDYDYHRLSLGVPVFGKDFLSEKTFPMDANMDALDAIDYRKGCFVGQEVASRMKRKGEVRKRSLIVQAKDDLLEAGATIKSGETTLGEITSASHKNGLALIRLDRLEKAGSDIVADERPVTLSHPAYLS